MIIEVEGYRKQNLELYQSVGNAVEFYGEVLLGKRMAKNVYVLVKLTKNLKKKEQAYGFCHITDDSLSRPREFMIELDSSMKNSFEQILIWLAHEMVHLKQFVRKELWDYESGSVQWKSKRYVRSPEYDDMPWEREAYRLEGELYEMFEEWYYE